MQNILDKVEMQQRRKLGVFWRGLIIGFCAIVIALAVWQAFNWDIGFVLMSNSYLYILMALLFAPAYLLYPPKKGAFSQRLFILDVIFFLITFGICIYYAIYGFESMQKGWGYAAPLLPTIFSVVLWVSLIEVTRRTAGIAFAAIMGVFSLYPMFASHMPGLLEGHQVTFLQTSIFHIMSTSSVLGIPMTMMGQLIIGYILFGAVLMFTGGGEFFLNLANAILGKTRGGSAKVAVLGSALFGSISGSAMANVITTGSVTIPAMKKLGFEPHVAGAVETCASTGGMLMPPVMGATAFVMAGFLGVSYVQVVIAAIIPSLLYYFGLLIQVDGYAATKGLKAPEDFMRPSLLKVLLEGWPFVACFVTLICVLLFLFQEYWAPYIAIAVLFICLMVRKSTRLNIKGFLQILEKTWPAVAEMSIMLGCVGFAIGAFSLTGVGNSLAREIVALAGGNVYLLLVFGAVASFILGMGMPATACYVFLIIILAPALLDFGFWDMGIHLFVLYWGVLSAITPPVCLAAMAAAPLAGAPGMKIGLTATRMAGVIYFIPFFFVLNSALLMHSDAGDILLSFILATLGVFLISVSFQGYFQKLGRLDFKYKLGYLIRFVLFVAGCLIALPFSQGRIIGLVVAAVIILCLFIRKKIVQVHSSEAMVHTSR